MMESAITYKSGNHFGCMIGTCWGFVMQPSGSLQTGSREAVIRQPLGSPQLVIRQLSGGKKIHCAAYGTESLFSLVIF